MGILMRLFIATIVFFLFWWLYALVLAPVLAVVIAMCLALAELLGPVILPRGGVGGSLRALMSMGAPLIVWPCAVLALQLLGSLLSHDGTVALAGIVASFSGLLAAGHGSGRDAERNTAALMSCLIPLDALGTALTAPTYEPAAIGLGCAGIAVAAMVVRQALVLPHEHTRLLAAVAAVCMVVAVIGAAPALISLIGSPL